MKYGTIYATAGVARDTETNPEFRRDLAKAWERYRHGDWGDLCEEDKETNEDALRCGARILASYQTCLGKIWIITEAEDDEGNRAATTFLYPSEY